MASVANAAQPGASALTTANGGEKDVYVLPRNPEEIERLACQHYMLAIALEHLYHPKLGDLSQFRNILDSGCGSGIWLSTVAQGAKDINMYDTKFPQQINLHPDAILEGSDISDEQFPKPLPARISELYVHDSLKAWPKEKQERYDFVNQHYLALGFDREAFVMALKNLKDTMKPGAYISVQELLAVMRPPDGRQLSPSLAIINRVFTKVLLVNTPDRVVVMDTFLPEVLEAAGFVDVDIFKARWDYGALGKRFGQKYLDHNRYIFPRFFGAMKKRFLKLGGGDGVTTSEQFDKVLGQALEDAMSEGLWWEEVFALARKPL